MINKIIAAIIILLTKLITGMNVRWLYHPIPEEQYIFYANHSSHFDFLVIWASLPDGVRSKTRPVAADDYWTKSVIKKYISKDIFNSVFINRQKKDGSNPVEIMLQALRAGSSLVLFPEGTRSLNGVIGEFKAGIYQLTLNRADIKIIPVYLENLNRILPKGEIIPIPLIGNVTYGEPISFKAGENIKEYLTRLRESLVCLNQ